MTVERMRPEHRLLTRCARTRQDARTRQEIEELLRERVDWGCFLRSALGHGVAPLCYLQLLSSPPELVPAEAMVFFREHAKAVAGRNLYLSAKLVALVREFRNHGVTAIPYKGPVLAMMAYGNLALREFADLDLVLTERDLPRAWEMLKAEGYAAQQPGGPASDAGQYAFVSSGGDYLVEVHSERTLRHFPRPLDPGRLTRSLAPVELNGEPI